GNAAIVSVEDTGIGFAPDMGERLFRPYSQLATAHGGPQGLGIGLSLVQGIVTLHGGAVDAKSDGPGKGARFTVRLPLAAPVALAGEGGVPGADTVPPAGLRVLVADDNRDAADSLQRVLQHYRSEE